MEKNTNSRLEYLDGLRGLAALWVFIGHIAIELNVKVPVIDLPMYAVDLFMIISGFLMYYHAVLREDREPMDHFSTAAKFWIRRFFRIAPLYFFMLAIAFMAGSALLPMSDSMPVTAHYPVANFVDTSWQNIVSHLTFTFGFFPVYCFRTLLPDWSIGLEMQFYLFFPLIFLLMHKLGHIKTTLLLIVISIFLWAFFFDYLHSFTLPTTLAHKINMFLSGMLICAAMKVEPKKMWNYIALAVAIAGLPLPHALGLPSSFLRMFIVCVFAVLALHRQMALPKRISLAVDFISHQMGKGVFYWLGELSYSVYLIHLLFIIVVGSYVANGFAAKWSGHMQFLVTCAILVVPVYAIAWVLHVSIEKPGIQIGKAFIAGIKKSRQPVGAAT